MTLDAPIYALWFSATGCGPDHAIIRVHDLADSTLGLGYSSLGFTFDPNPSGFSLGHCPFGAGPMLSRDDVAKLHAALGEWLAANPQEKS